MQYAELLADPVVRGVTVGECVDGAEWGETADYKEVAHAHTRSTHDRYVGHICVKSWDDLFEGHQMRVSAVVLEELAHLRADAGHTEAWRREMHKLGVSVPPMHRKRKR